MFGIKLGNLLLIAGIGLTLSCSESNLPTLDIVKTTPIGWQDKESCVLLYNGYGNEIEIPARIKCRGGVSRRYDKHSFSVELSSAYGLCNLPPDDDWVLNANYIDKTFMRHKICFDLFMQMNQDNVAPACSYLNVMINHDYAGLFVLMEEINASRVGLDKKDTMAMLFKEPPVFYQDRLVFIQDSLNYYQQKYPDISVSDKTSYMESFRDFLFHSDDHVFASEIARWIDMDNIMDWHLLLMITNNADGLMKNFYLYKQNAQTPFRIAIWDYDHCLGRDGDNELNMLINVIDCNKSILFKRLTMNPEMGYRKKLKDRWIELRESEVFTLKNLKCQIDRNDRRIRREVSKNFVKWPVESQWYYDNNTYADEIVLLLNFVEIRLHQLDDYFSRW